MPQTPLTNTVKINTTVAGAQFAPAIAVLSGGGYVIVWQDSSAGAIYAQRFSATGQPVGAELHLSNTQGGSPIWVSVAAIANDGFVIAFQAGSFAQAEIFGQRYDSINNPVGGLFAVNSTSPNEQFNPHVTTLDGGGLLFTWDTQAFDVFQEVRGRIYLPDGQALGNDFAIAPMSATIKNGLSAIAPLPGGGFVVTWQSATGGGDNYEIVGQRFTSSGATVGAQFQVNTQTTNNQHGNDVARLSDGGFVVSWVDPVPNEGGGRVVARHYDASGNAIGGEILVDTKASGAYGRTVVTALANGGYVVSWPDGENNVNVAHNVSARAFGSNDVALDPAFDMSFDSPFGANFFSDGAVTLPNGNVVFAWDGPSVGTGTSQDIYMRMYEIGGAAPPPDSGGPGPDSLNGTSGPDTLNGMGGNDILNGGAGNDRLDGGTGADRMAGGTNDDWYFVDNAGDVVVEAAGEGTDRIFASVSYALGTGVHVETLGTTNNAGTAALNLTGNELANTIFGNAGANILDGKGGADTLAGFGGNDLYFIDNAADRVVEGASEGTADRVFAGVSYTLGTGVHVETLSTNNNGGTAPINLTGNELANIIFGNEGANLLDGKAGADTLAGFGGDDLYFVDSAADRVVESAGQGGDRVFASASWVLGAGVSVESLTTTNNAGTAAINLTGNALAQSIVGNAGANRLDGGGGGDTMVGLGGDDFYFVRAAGDRAVEAAGGGNDRVFAAISFTLEAGSAVETLSTSNNAGTTAINLTGNELANTIFGNAGANILDGKGGADTLAGSAGADGFAFTTALGGGNVDRIVDFQSGVDKIRLDDAIFTGIGTPGAFNAAAFVTGAAAADGNDRIVYNGTTGQLSFDADGSGAGAAVLFATLDGHPVLTASDFMVI